MGQTISEPTAAERGWISDNITAARGVVGDPVDPTALDATWADWIARWRVGEEDPNPTVTMLGQAFGQWLVDRLGLASKVVEDEYGTEIAVHGGPGTSSSSR